MEKKIEAIIQELKQYPREPKSLTWIESVLEKHLQEPTEKRKVEIKREMEKLKSSLDKLKFMGLSVTYNTYYSLVEELRENNIDVT